MATVIRMARGGRKKQPFYHIVVADSRRSRNGKFIEKLGYFDPFAAEGSKLNWDAEKVANWLNTGAQPSDRIAKMLIANKVGTDAQRKKFEAKLKVGEKAIQTRIAAEKAAKEAEEAAAKAAEEAEAAAE